MFYLFWAIVLVAGTILLRAARRENLLRGFPYRVARIRVKDRTSWAIRLRNRSFSADELAVDSWKARVRTVSRRYDYKFRLTWLTYWSSDFTTIILFRTAMDLEPHRISNVCLALYACGWLWATDQKAEQRTSKCTSKGYKTNERLSSQPTPFFDVRKDILRWPPLWLLCIYCIISARIDCRSAKVWKSETQGESALPISDARNRWNRLCVRGHRKWKLSSRVFGRRKAWNPVTTADLNDGTFFMEKRFKPYSQLVMWRSYRSCRELVGEIGSKDRSKALFPIPAKSIHRQHRWTGTIPERVSYRNSMYFDEIYTHGLLMRITSNRALRDDPSAPWKILISRELPCWEWIRSDGVSRRSIRIAIVPLMYLFGKRLFRKLATQRSHRSDSLRLHALYAKAGSLRSIPSQCFSFYWLTNACIVLEMSF